MPAAAAEPMEAARMAWCISVAASPALNTPGTRVLPKSSKTITVPASVISHPIDLGSSDPGSSFGAKKIPSHETLVPSSNSTRST
ncbi:hypothetical protein D1872_269960 [compost metagenome]